MPAKYRRMLRGMSAKEGKPFSDPAEKMNGCDDVEWRLYILRCKDGSFYTGVTKDIERRFKMHNDGKASRYTRTRRPVELLYQESCGSRTAALVRECAVKGYSRQEKERLVAAHISAGSVQKKRISKRAAALRKRSA